jgi:hypothetical protein
MTKIADSVDDTISHGWASIEAMVYDQVPLGQLKASSKHLC